MGGDRGNVNVVVVQVCKEQDRCKVGEFCISDDGFVGWLGIEVSSYSSNFVDVVREVVEGNEQGIDFISNSGDLVVVFGSGSDREVVVIEVIFFVILLSYFESDGVSYRFFNIQWYDVDYVEVCSKRGFGYGLYVVVVGGSNVGNEGSDVDEVRQNDSVVVGLVIMFGDFKFEVVSNSFNENFGVFDVGDQRNLVVNGYMVSLVIMVYVVGGVVVFVVGWQVDVEVDCVFG